VLASLAARRDVAELFHGLITRPLQRVHRPEHPSSEAFQPSSGSRRLIVLDALDECDLADQELLFQLIGKFDLTTPDWLYVLVTVRNDDKVRLASRLRSAYKVELREDAETVADIRSYLRSALEARIEPIHLDGAVAQLTENTHINFLCARFFKVCSKNRTDSFNGQYSTSACRASHRMIQ